MQHAHTFPLHVQKRKPPSTFKIERRSRRSCRQGKPQRKNTSPTPTVARERRAKLYKNSRRKQRQEKELRLLGDEDVFTWWDEEKIVAAPYTLFKLWCLYETPTSNKERTFKYPVSLRGYLGANLRMYCRQIMDVNARNPRPQSVSDLSDAFFDFIKNNKRHPAFTLLSLISRPPRRHDIIRSAFMKVGSPRELNQLKNFLEGSDVVHHLNVDEGLQSPCSRHSYNCVVCASINGWKYLRTNLPVDNSAIDVAELNRSFQLFSYGWNCQVLPRVVLRFFIELNFPDVLRACWRLISKKWLAKEGYPRSEASFQELLDKVPSMSRKERIALILECRSLGKHLLMYVMDHMQPHNDQPVDKAECLLDECLQPIVFPHCRDAFESVDLLTRHVIASCNETVNVPTDVRRLIFQYHGAFRMDTNIEMGKMHSYAMTPATYALSMPCLHRYVHGGCRLVRVLKKLFEHGCTLGKNSNTLKWIWTTLEYTHGLNCPKIAEIAALLAKNGAPLFCEDTMHFPYRAESLLSSSLMMASDQKFLEAVLAEMEHRSMDHEMKHKVVNGCNAYSAPLISICDSHEWEKSVCEGILRLFLDHPLFDVAKHDQLIGGYAPEPALYWEVRGRM